MHFEFIKWYTDIVQMCLDKENPLEILALKKKQPVLKEFYKKSTTEQDEVATKYLDHKELQEKQSGFQSCW